MRNQLVAEPSTTLKFTNLTVISNAACAAFYGIRAILPSNICTRDDYRGICFVWFCFHCELNCWHCFKGDSGGPLVVKDSSNTWMQIGINSFVSGAGCTAGPAGYTRVSSFLGWLSEKTGQGILCQKIQTFRLIKNGLIIDAYKIGSIVFRFETNLHCCNFFLFSVLREQI